MSQPIRAIITGNRLDSEHTTYFLELHAGGAKLMSIPRRYREFAEFHAQLTKRKHAFPIPELPPKKFFGKTSPSFVTKRQKELQAFLDQLVQRIIANPPAEAAWRLFCLFLGLDPKQDVPEAIVSTASLVGASGNSLNSTTGATSHAMDLANAYDPASSTAMLAVPDSGDLDNQHDQQSLEAEELQRMERIVDDFARQTINVSRHVEERLQIPPASLIAHVPLDLLSKTLSTHILSHSFVPNSEISSRREAQGDSSEEEQSNAEEDGAEISGTIHVEKSPPSADQPHQFEPLSGIDDLIVSLGKLGNEASKQIQ